jgi:hypothetical protein
LFHDFVSGFFFTALALKSAAETNELQRGPNYAPSANAAQSSINFRRFSTIFASGIGLLSFVANAVRERDLRQRAIMLGFIRNPIAERTPEAVHRET